MKIIINSLEEKVEVESDVEFIHDVMDLMERALLGYGFQPNTVKQGFLGKIEDYEEEENED